MRRIPLGRFAGQVPTPFAVYRAPIFGGGSMLPSTVGIASFAETAPTPYISILIEKRDAALERANGLVGKAVAEKRDLSDDELASVKADKAEADKRDAQITEISALEDRSLKVAEDRAKFAGAIGPKVQVTRNESTYRPGTGSSFIRDLVAASRGDWGAAERLHRNNLEAQDAEERAWKDAESKNEGRNEFRDGTTGSTSMGSYIPPVWLVEELAQKARVGRVLAPFLRDGGFPTTNSITIPRVTTGASAAGQAGDNAAVSETDQVTAQLTRTTVTIAGQQDVSIQSIDLSPYPVDRIIFADLAAAYEAELDRQIERGSGTNELLGINQVSGINAVTYTDATPTVPELYPKFADAIQQIHTGRFLPPQLVVMHPRRWGWMLASLDTQNRPLIVPVAPVNAVAVFGDVASQGIVGSVQGVAVATTASGSTALGAGTEDQIIVARTQDMILMEGPRRTRVLAETLSGNLTVRLQLWAYCNLFAGRFPAGISTIGGTGLIAPTF